MDISQHCNKRSSQRAISTRQISIVVDYGLSWNHKDDVLYYMSNKNIETALKQGVVKKQEADKLKNIFVVMEKYSNAVVTTYRPNKKKQKTILKKLA